MAAERPYGPDMIDAVRALSWGLALVAALLFAISATLQQAAARAEAVRSADTAAGGAVVARRPWLPILGMLGRLARDRLWLLGWLLNVTGFLAHSFALHLGSIAVVQAILVIQLMFAVGTGALLRRQRPRSRDWWGTALVCSGVILVVLLQGDAAQVVPPRPHVARAIAVTVTGIAIIVIAARGIVRPHLRSGLVAVGAGLAFCTTAILIVTVTSDLSQYGLLGLLNWPAPALAISAGVGSLLVQDSFAAGPLPMALTAMTVTDPVASGIAGLLLFDATVPSPPALLGLAGAAVLIAVGVRIVANSASLITTPLPFPAPAES
jgi:multisubunit Na+/H+ antiporter MnhF subunit